jgi:hypothetical protein
LPFDDEINISSIIIWVIIKTILYIVYSAVKSGMVSLAYYDSNFNTSATILIKTIIVSYVSFNLTDNKDNQIKTASNYRGFGRSFDIISID